MAGTTTAAAATAPATVAAGTEKTVIIAPRWGGNPHSDWYDWIVAELGAVGVKVVVFDHPTGTPTIENYGKALDDGFAKYKIAPGPNTFLVGHSVGNQALLHYLARARTPETPQFGGLLLMAFWYTVDTPWADIVPWISGTPTDYKTINEAVKLVHTIVSDNDQFTAGYAATLELFHARFGAKSATRGSSLIPEGKHFNDATCVPALNQLKTWLALPITATSPAAAEVKAPPKVCPYTKLTNNGTGKAQHALILTAPAPEGAGELDRYLGLYKTIIYDTLIANPACLTYTVGKDEKTNSLVSVSTWTTWEAADAATSGPEWTATITRLMREVGAAFKMPTFLAVPVAISNY